MLNMVADVPAKKRPFWCSLFHFLNWNTRKIHTGLIEGPEKRSGVRYIVWGSVYSCRSCKDDIIRMDEEMTRRLGE